MIGNLMQIQQMYQKFRQNPMSMLTQIFNIPKGMDNPQDIVQHLLNTNQVTQAQVNNAMQMRNNLPQDMFR